MKILFEDGVCEEVDVTTLSPGVVRLEETPLASTSELHFGDEIELELGEQSIWKYVRVSKRADHQSASILLSYAVANSKDLETVLADITQHGCTGSAHSAASSFCTDLQRRSPTHGL